MTQTFINLRTMFIISAAVLLIQACKKTDPWNNPCCSTGPACDVQTLLVSARDPDHPGGTYPEPYKFHKTYGPDGRINYMDAFVGPGWAYQHFKGAVYYAGNHLYMLNSARDTILVANLNACGQPVSAIAITHYPDPAWPPATWRYEYYYDRKGRLSRVNWFFEQRSTPDYKDVYQYDQYDNVISIHNELDTSRVEYTYDYRRPIKGGYYEQGVRHAIGTELLEFLGHLNTQPHHLLVQIANNYEYPQYTWPYWNQVVNADGYLVSYKTNLYDNEFIGAIKSDITWKCGKGSGQKD